MTTEHLADLDSDPRPLRVAGPGDLLQAVPYLLGFHPQTSLVIVGLHAARLVVTVRLDLADLAEPRVLDEALEAIHGGGATELVGAIFDDDCAAAAGRALPWRGAAEMFGEGAAAAGCAVIDTLLVCAGRWWSFTCTRPECCPPEGRELSPGATEFAAAATFAGMVALPDRGALAAVLDPLPQADRERLAPQIEQREHAAVQAVLDGRGARHDRSVKRALFAAARAADAATAAGEPVALSDDEAARFGAALSGYEIRDSLWMAADDGRLDGRALWRELARRLPGPYDAAPLFLFGWCAWRAGNGALAGIAAQRAIDSDPGYSAADLLLAALSRGLDPRRLPKLRLPRSA